MLEKNNTFCFICCIGNGVSFRFDSTNREIAKNYSKKIYNEYNCIEAFIIYHLFFSVGFTVTGLGLLNKYLCHHNTTLHHPYFIWQVIISPVNAINVALKKLLTSMSVAKKKIPRALHIYRASFTEMYLKTLMQYISDDNNNYEGQQRQNILEKMIRTNWTEEMNSKKLLVPPDNIVVAVLQTYPLYFLQLKLNGTDPMKSKNFLDCGVSLHTFWDDINTSLKLPGKTTYKLPKCWDLFRNFKYILSGEFIWEYTGLPDTPIRKQTKKRKKESSESSSTSTSDDDSDEQAHQQHLTEIEEHLKIAYGHSRELKQLCERIETPQKNKLLELVNNLNEEIENRILPVLRNDKHFSSPLKVHQAAAYATIPPIISLLELEE